MANGLISGIAAAVTGVVLPVPDTDGIDADYMILRAGHDNAVPNSNHDVGLTGVTNYAGNFFWDFYNRVYVTPKHIDFGALSAQATQYIDVWSAWLVSTTLGDISESSTDGLDLFGVAPKAYAPLELANYSVTALLDGPPTIEGRYTFEFTSGDAPMVTVSGSRAKVWPFPVDWKTGFRVNLSFKTETWASRSGKEQRRALRTTPRKSVEFTSITRGDKLRSFRALMASWQNKVMIMPDVTRKVLLSAPAAGGSTSVTVDAVKDWTVADATVVLSEGERREIRKIDHVEGLTIFFTASGGAWSQGAKMHPGLEGTLSGDLRAAQFTDDKARVNVKFDVLPTTEPPRDQGSPVATLEGREVFTRTPNWKDGIDVNYQYPSEVVDYGRGVIATFRPIDFSTQLFKATYVGRDAANLTLIQQFYERMKGRRGEFHASTGLADLVIAQTALVGNFFLRVAGQEVFTAYAQDTVHRAIEVKMIDGTRFFRKLVGTDPITTVSDSFGDDTLIQVSAAWPYTLTPENVSRISWLPAARLASDDLTIEYLTDEVGQVQLAIQTLEDLPVE